MTDKLVLTLSGGMDSSVLLYMAQDRGYNEIFTLTFDYGQRHLREISCAKLQLDNFKKQYPEIKVHNKVVNVQYISDIAPTSSLTNLEIDNPDVNESAGEAQPASYVPYRNMMFLSICNSFAEGVGAKDVWYGAAQVDSLAGYWDGDQNFVDTMNAVTKLNREHKISIKAPLLEMSKEEIVKEGIRLGCKFEDTWTCYSNREDGLADATTPSSSLRISGFLDSGYIDPIKYLQQEKLNELYEQKGCEYITTH
jgi:7-cyano-7-deazaguanine synthase